MSGDSRPQQPELARSGRTPVDPDHAPDLAERPTGEDGADRLVPPENRPGHHPDREQDVPEALGGAGHGGGRGGAGHGGGEEQ
jgi:hypothetical protein